MARTMSDVVLLDDHRSPGLLTAIARLPLARLVAALLAVVAMIGMVALSTWHAAEIHGDPPTRLVSLIDAHPDHQNSSNTVSDPEAAIHFAAHAVGHSLALPVETLLMLRISFTRQIWTATTNALRPGPAPASLLRPPRN